MNNYRKAVAILGFMFVASAYADVQFGWANHSANALTNHLGATIPQSQATVLTFLSGDAVIDFDPLSPLASSYGSGAGADVFLRAQNNTSTSSRYSTNTPSLAGNDLVGKYVYAVVLELPFSQFVSIATVPAGTYFGISQMGYTQTSGVGNPAPIQQFSATDPTTVGLYRGGPVQTSLQVIPEPAGATLIVMGLGILLARRIKARNS